MITWMERLMMGMTRWGRKENPLSHEERRPILALLSSVSCPDRVGPWSMFLIILPDHPSRLRPVNDQVNSELTVPRLQAEQAEKANVLLGPALLVSHEMVIRAISRAVVTTGKRWLATNGTVEIGTWKERCKFIVHSSIGKTSVDTSLLRLHTDRWWLRCMRR